MKRTLVIALLSMACLSVPAHEVNEQRIRFVASVIDEGPINVGVVKSPVAIPSVYQNGYELLFFEGGYNGSINYSKSGDSSHDWYQKIPYSCRRTNVGDLVILSEPISANLTVSFRGFPNPVSLYLSIDNLCAIGSRDMVIDNS